MASIQKRGENSWLLVAEAGHKSNGKRQKRTRTIRIEDEKLLRTSKRLQDYLNEELTKFKIEVEAGEYIAPEKMTFAAFTGEWREKYGNKHLEQKTLETYAHMLKNHIIPVFGHIRLADVLTPRIVSFIDSLEHEGARKDGKVGGLSSTTVRFIHRIMKDIFDRAVDWGVIKSNPVSKVKRPKVTKKKMEVYNEEEAGRLFACLEKEPIHWRIMITLALTTGLRRGELLALEWEHLDLNKFTINVCQSLSYVQGTTIIKEPKTENSNRKVTIPEDLIPELKAYMVHAKEERFKAGGNWEGDGRFFVFASVNGKPFYHTVPGTWFRRFTKRNKLKSISFHALRHTSATLLINQGVHAKTISSRLGHADIRTTMNVYGHALKEADQSAANSFNSLLNARNKKESLGS